MAVNASMETFFKCGCIKIAPYSRKFGKQRDNYSLRAHSVIAFS